MDKLKNNQISWKAVKGLRNKIVHDYGKVDFGVIFDTVTKDIPILLGQLNSI